MEQEHKRRVRYKGTHPRKYQEKYKELNPEKYQRDVEKILQQGKTPAGMHIPICVEEILQFFDIQPGQIGLDATLGYGGHSRRMLEKLGGQGHLYATDVDPIESEKTRLRLAQLGYGPEILTVRRMNFADLDQVAPGVAYDFVLADLGVSSMQIDNPARGFTFKQEGPLDLRLDPTAGVPAAQRLRELSREELAAMLVENADEPYAEQIAAAVRARLRKGGAIETTRELAETVAGALCFLPPRERKEAEKKACQRTFQALRIDVNNEFEVLYRILGAPGLGYIREWLIKNHRIIASVDLHVDTFQPRNGTQTSVLFLQKKTKEQKDAEEKSGTMADYNIFMAMVDKVGHDKRGNPIFKRDKEGNEILVPDTSSVLVLGKTGDGSRTVAHEQKRKVEDDQTSDVPPIFAEWKKREGLSW